MEQELKEGDKMKILHINANPKPVEEAHSRQLTEIFFDTLKESVPSMEINTVNLYDSPPPFYSYANYRHFWYPLFIEGYKASEEEVRASRYALEQGRLFNDADMLVITSPMWNFSVPAILKAWEDMVLSPGLTFEVGPGGTKPLHRIRKIIMLVSSGGAYPDGDLKDNLTRQIKSAFGFAGIRNYEIAWADGQNPFFFKDMDERMRKAEEKARSLALSVAEEYEMAKA